MYGRMTVLAALIVLAACANVAPAGRNARGGMEAPPAPPPARAATVTPAPRPLPPPTYSPPPPAPVSRAPAASAPPPVLVMPPSSAPVTTAPSGPAPAVVAPPVAAPSVAAPAADRPPPRNSDDEVVVPGTIQRQLPPPNGDPRTEDERMQDINSWDRCVTHVQSAFESDPMRPQLTTPEEYCSQSLGMANRTAVPISRQSRRPPRSR